MSADDATLGLRERKKRQTRQHIRQCAMNLFTAKGYAETTVDDIAAAADVSPRTFFRYFPTKESVVVADDLDELLVAVFEEQPADTPPVAGIRQALITALERASDDEWVTNETRQRLLFTVPELRSALFTELERTIDLLGSMLARRTGRPADDFEVRVTAGAVVGALLGLGLGTGPRTDKYERALDFLESGLPLR
jgi:AcrR family transcriptional regulator